VQVLIRKLPQGFPFHQVFSFERSTLVNNWLNVFQQNPNSINYKLKPCFGMMQTRTGLTQGFDI